MMSKFFDKRKSSQLLWSSLVISTLVACGTLVYISLVFEKPYKYQSQNLKNFFNTPEKLIEENCISVCDSPECVLQSQHLLSRMNTAAYPCEDAFDFSCGKYKEQFTEEESRTFISQVSSDMRVTLKNVLDNIDADPKSTSGKLKTVYDSCMKQSSSDSQAVPILLKQLADFGIPNWPHLAPNFKFAEPRIIDVLGNFLKYQEYGFIDFAVPNYRRKPIVSAMIYAVESSYNKKEKSLRKYLVERVLLFFDVDSEKINETWVELEAVNDAIVHLREESERIYKENKKKTSLYSLECGVADTEIAMEPMCEILESLIDSADASSVVSKRFANVPGSSVYFMQNIMHVLSCFSDRSIADYLALNLILNHMDDLSFYFRLAFQKDPQSIARKTLLRTEIGHWQHCVEWLIGNMFIPLAHEYFNQVMTMSVLEEIEDIIQKSINETADGFSNEGWLAESTRLEIRQEIDGTSHSIGKLKPLLANETLLNDLYDQFHPSDASFLHNVFKFQRFSKAEKLQGLLSAADLGLVTSNLLRPGASAGWQFIAVQLGIFMPPVFRSGLERIMNVISFATVGAHEVGHIINFITDRLQESNVELKKYMDNVLQCLNNRYSQFRFDFLGKNLNAVKYTRENFADIVAIVVIDKLIDKYTSEDNMHSLPAFPYSLKQMLYLSAVQVWCETHNKKDEEQNDLYFYALGKFRLLGMIQNSKGFAETFSCPEGSSMNPSVKCSFFE